MLAMFLYYGLLIDFFVFSMSAAASQSLHGFQAQSA
jgi:hypothetical protein